MLTHFTQLDASATQSIGGRDVPESAFSLKHHPHISNVRFDGKAYRATRLIGPGDEIFLPFEEHPHSFVDEPIFRTIPTASDFQQAEEIFTIEAETQIPQTLRENRALMDKIPKRGRINNSAGGNDALKMVKQSVALFSEVVAALLPITLTYVKDLFQYEGEFSHAVLRNRTIYWLEIHGHCMGDVQVEDGKVIAKRLIKKGSRIMVAPLYIKEKPETCLNGENECTNTGSTCLTHEGSKLLVCPLASSLKYSSNSGTANADYSWGQWNTFNYAANNRKSADEILSYHSNGMSMDIIATQDINNGDEIVVAVEENARNSFGVRAKDGFFRKEWITETVAVDPPIA